MMNRQPPAISDNDIHSLVDNELDETRRERIRDAILDNPSLLDRARQYQLINAGLVTDASEADEEAVPDRLLQAALGHHRRPRHYGRAAGLLVSGLIAGYLAAIGLRYYDDSLTPLASLDSDLVQPAALAHAVYSPEVKHPVEVTAEQEAHLVKWLSKRLDSDIRAPQLTAAGFSLVGGRLLPSSNDIAAQFMYENPKQQRVTLYVRHGIWGNQESAFSYSENDGIGTFYWIDGSMGYAFSGDVPRAILLDLATRVYEQLE